MDAGGQIRERPPHGGKGIRSEHHPSLAGDGRRRPAEKQPLRRPFPRQGGIVLTE
jgi:hypothetical protein